MSSENPYPPRLTNLQEVNLVQTAKDWALANGLSVRPPPSLILSESDPDGILATSAPVTLFPSRFPRHCFDQAVAVQKTYNELYAKISRDEEFLAQVVKDVIDGDEFVANLWNVHSRVKEEGYVQTLSLGLFRSDYMVHEDSASGKRIRQIKQIEFNTISSSFGGLSTQTTLLHRHLATVEYPLLDPSISGGSLDIPQSKSSRLLAAGLKAAYDAYHKTELNYDRCILFVVQAGERNIFDQRHLEHQLARYSPPIPVFRLLFSEILQHTSLANTPRRQLLYHIPWNRSRVFEVSVVYLRSGYGPSDYPDGAAWEARHLIERSSAIKCPTVLTQLAGIKKVQQLLATPKPTGSPSVLSRFIPEEASSTADLWRTFANIYPMDASEAGLEARKKATDPELCDSFVLKPQREGGGNNIYRSAIPKFLKSLPERHWGSYILMELITPPSASNTILRNGKLEMGDVISELGIYGTCLWNQESGELLHNEEAGYLLRTKGSQSEEGGVAAGFGCMDSCVLVN